MAGKKNKERGVTYTYTHHLRKHMYKKLAQLQLAKGDIISMTDLAEIVSNDVGLSKATILNYLQHPNKGLQLGTAFHLADYFGVTVEEIITVNVHMKEE